MAINQITEKKEIIPSEGKIYLEIDNGDLKALNLIKTIFRFKDFEGILRFALVILLRADNNTIYIDEKGKRVKITPTEEVTESKNDPETS
ncbi:MAG: hypothetical protein AAB553_06235 [Patescibacteria group bacterium]